LTKWISHDKYHIFTVKGKKPQEDAGFSSECSSR